MYKIVLLYFFMTFLCLTKNYECQAQFDIKPPLNEIDRQIKMQKLLKSYAWLREFSGAIIVLKDSVPVVKYASGYANLDYKVPSSLTEKINTCDLTHTFTAITIMQLMEQGKLSVNDKVSKHLPDFPSEIGDSITIHHLLTHTAGLLDYYEMPNYINRFLFIHKVKDLVKIIAETPLQHQPGSKFQRSGSHYVLLARIIEKVSNKSYKDYITQHIIKKIGLSNTGLYMWKEPVNNKAMSYTIDEEGEANIAADFWGAFPFGSDAIYSSVEDLLTLLDAFNKNLLVSEATKQIMLRPYAYKDDSNKEDYYGYGWQVKQVDGKKVLYQGGYLLGLSSQVRQYEDSGYSFAIMCNFHPNKAEEIADKLEYIIFNDNTIVPTDPLAYYLNTIAEDKGLAHVMANLDNILTHNKYKLEKVWTMYAWGNNYMDIKDYESALKIFTLNAQLFPDEAIVYDSLGDCYRKMGNFDLALLNFKKKLTLQPSDKRAKSMINHITAKMSKETPVEQ